MTSIDDTPLAGPVVYVLLDYPIPSERFLEREIRALQRLRVTVHIITLRAGRGTVEEREGLWLWRRPTGFKPELWIPAFRALVHHPRAALKLLHLAWITGAEDGLRGRYTSLRQGLYALYYAHELGHRQPTLLHAHFASAPATLALLLAAWMNLPWGFSCHASDVYAEPNDLPHKVRHANHVLACSDVLAEDLRRRLPPGLHGRVHTVHHGLDLAVWRRPTLQREGEEVPLILAIGRFEAKKGLSVLLEACALLRDAHFPFRCEMIGAGRQEARLRRQIAALDLTSHVRLLSWCDAASLRRAYARAAVLAVPSVIAADGNRDNIPNVVLEALACEAPIVASALPALVQILGPSQAARLVPPGEPEPLAQALRQVCSEPSLAQGLRHRGAELLRRHFDLPRNSRRVLKYFVQSSRESALGP
jgi:glycosyltransferase involved in cell wall biosynthesis